MTPLLGYQIAALAGLCLTLAVLWVALSLLGALAIEIFADRGDDPGSFEPFIVGLVVFIVAAAGVVTGGASLMMAVLPLFWFAARRPRRPDAKRIFATGLAALRSLPWIVVFFVGPVLFVHRGPAPWLFGLPHWDDVFFGRLAKSLVETGCENVRPFLSVLQSGHCGVATYHYPEEWLAGVISVVSGGSPSHLMLFVVGPLLLGGIWLGLLDLLMPLPIGSLGRKLLAAGIALLPAPQFTFLSNIHPLEEIGAFGGMHFFDLRAGAGKEGIVVLGVVGILRALERKNPQMAILILLGLVPFSASAAPAALSVAALLALMGPSEHRLRTFGRLVSVVAALGLVLGIFGERQPSMHSLTSIASLAGTTANLHTRLNVIGKTLIQMTVAFFPYWLILTLLSKRFSTAGTALRAGFVAVIGGTLGYAAVFQLPDSPQFATRFPALFLGLASAVFAVRFVFATRETSLALRAALVALLIGAASGHLTIARAELVAERRIDYRWQQTTSYLEAARRFVPQTNVGGFLLSPTEVSQTWNPSRPVPTFTPHVYSLGTFIGAFPQYQAISLLSPPDQTYDPRRFGLAQFSHEWIPGENLDAQQARIIEKYCVSYLVASREAQLPALVRFSEVARDEGTGERLLTIESLPSKCRPFTPAEASFWKTLFLPPL